MTCIQRNILLILFYMLVIVEFKCRVTSISPDYNRHQREKSKTQQHYRHHHSPSRIRHHHPHIHSQNNNNNNNNNDMTRSNFEPLPYFISKHPNLSIQPTDHLDNTAHYSNYSIQNQIAFNDHRRQTSAISDLQGISQKKSTTLIPWNVPLLNQHKNVRLLGSVRGSTTTTSTTKPFRRMTITSTTPDQESEAPATAITQSQLKFETTASPNARDSAMIRSTLQTTEDSAMIRSTLQTTTQHQNDDKKISTPSQTAPSDSDDEYEDYDYSYEDDAEATEVVTSIRTGKHNQNNQVIQGNFFDKRIDLAYVDSYASNWRMNPNNLKSAVGTKVEHHHHHSNHRSQLNDDLYNYLEDEAAGDDDGRSLTDKKWELYGTAEAVEHAHRAEQIESLRYHMARVQVEGFCRRPHPRVIHMNDISYTPTCTILHRCGDETACCEPNGTHITTCVAVKWETVRLPFDVKDVYGNTTIQYMPFVNHTLCGCVNREITPPPNATENFCRCTRHFDVLEEVTQHENPNGQMDSDTRCYCGCLPQNEECTKLKQGEVELLAEDKLCIINGQCTAPTCEYGGYDRRRGKCPDSEDKIEIAQNYPNNN